MQISGGFLTRQPNVEYNATNDSGSFGQNNFPKIVLKVMFLKVD